MKENMRNLSEKLEEKQENMRSNSVNSRKVSLSAYNLSKCIENLHYQKFLFFTCICIKWLI